MVRPRWVLAWLRDGGLPDLTVPNMAGPGEPSPAFFAAYGKWMQTPPPSWADIGWLRGQWGGPFMVNGVMRPDDARRAAGIGATAISVSNHGGNDLDGVPASIRALPAVADAVGGQVEILLDGGIRLPSGVVTISLNRRQAKSITGGGSDGSSAENGASPMVRKHRTRFRAYVRRQRRYQ
jgi:hypothetical protein